LVFSKLGVMEGDGRTPELDKWAVRWAVIMNANKPIHKKYSNLNPP